MIQFCISSHPFFVSVSIALYSLLHMYGAQPASHDSLGRHIFSEHPWAFVGASLICTFMYRCGCRPTSCSFARARLLWFVVVISRYWSWAFYISHTCCAGNFQLQRHNIYLSRAWFLFNVDWPLSRRRRLRWRRGGLIGDLLSSLVRGRPRASELVLYATSSDYIIYEAAF